MSDRDFLTLDPELSALLDAERPIPAAPDGARARVHARLAASLVGLPPAPPPVAPGAPVHPVAPAAPAGPSHLRLGLTTLVGALAGGGLIYLLMQRVPVVPPAPIPAVVSAPVFEGPPLPTTRPAVEPVSAAPVPAPITTTAAPSHPHHKATRSHVAEAAPEEESGLSAERALLDRARSSLALGDVKAATQSLHAHERRFPDGQLAEERESLAIRTLVASGHGAEARARGDLFKARFPTSMHRPAVDATLQSIP